MSIAIAKFLGAKMVEEKTLHPLMRKWASPNFKPLHGKFISGHEFHFKTDWTWLMPLVTYIEGLGYEVLIGRISCQINPILDRENPIASMVCGDINKKHEIVYEACVQFIEWYEKNKSK
jgi:hypothetical protein